MAAARPEPAPAMGYFNHVSFGDSVWALADDDEMEELPSTVKLAYASSEFSFSNAGASMADVARVLYDCRPTIPSSVLRIREEALRESTTIASTAAGAQLRLEKAKPSNRDIQCVIKTLRSHMSGRPLPRVRNSNYKERRLPVRHLRVNDSGINAQELDDISALLCGHATLSTLALQSSELLPRPSGLFARLATAISLSNLRVIELSNNPIGPRSMCEFLDHLCAPNLSHLYLSMTMQRGLLFADTQMNPLWRVGDNIAAWQERMQSEDGKKQLWIEEMARVTDRLEKLVQLRREHEPLQAPYAPHLSLLSMNGNDLRWRNVRRLVTAILQYNTSLTHVELFATCDNDDSDEEGDENQEGSQTGPRSLRRVTSIGTAMMAQQRQLRASGTSNGQHGQITPPRVWHAHASPAKPAVQNMPGALSAKPVQKSDWRRVLGSHLWNNRFNSLEVKIAARHLLGPARVLTCKCRADDAQGKPSLAGRLPPEIWHRVITHLDVDNKLSPQQVERIISFASDPATIGYGRRSANLGLSPLAVHALERKGAKYAGLDQEENARNNDYGFLPHRPWQWSDMISRRSVPRDWPAQVIDETGRDNGDALLVEEAGLAASSGTSAPAVGTAASRSNPTRTDQHEHDGGGGGGPDGEGGVTIAAPNTTAVQSKVTSLPSRSRRVWLDEQSALQAFYEATGTYCAE